MWTGARSQRAAPLVFSFFVCTSLGSLPAEAYTYNICFEYESTFVDGGTGEDYWTNTGATSRKPRGIRAIIKDDGNTVFNGYLDDGVGAGPGKACTGDYDASDGDQLVYLYSYGKVQGNTIWVLDSAENYATWSKTFTVPYANGTYTVVLGDTGNLRLNIYQSMAFAVYRHAGGMSTEDYTVRVWDGASPCGSGGCYSSGKIWIGSNVLYKKFIHVHELGHNLIANATSCATCGANCEDLDDPTCGASAGEHSMTSKEYSRCALSEGFSHFYAADVFNSHHETGCSFEYYKDEFGGDPTPKVNCEVANGNFDIHYMEQNCGGSSTWDGRGTELDWLRQFWDVHTNASSPPSFTAIVNWIDDAEDWGDETAYDELDTEANTVGGTLDSNWDVMKGGTGNGIDH